MRDKQHRIVKGILALTLIWILNGCTYRQHPLKPAPEEPPTSVEIKPETPVSEPVTPVKPESERTVVAPKPPVLYLHKVRWPEETYSHIAKWYTGTVNNWRAIAKANPELDPKKIDIGDTISIPEDLMTSRKPMPHSFVRASVRKKTTPFSSSKKKSTPSESPKLFGPIESKPKKTETDPAKLFGPVETQPLSTKPDSAKLFGPIE
ncbi:MAG: LysM peptidoglycan-binding domain-containing protein [Deltaproteobacteria bacterium]|nr:LysM peptidoglycan-binding domain-containing protein [Deltaproteobacteria bacterium]